MMTTGKQTLHSTQVLSSLADEGEARRFRAAHTFLKKHLVHTRDILNGKDFLFSGPHADIHRALKTLVEVEHQCSRFLQVDYVQIDEYFLLRVAGSAQCREMISAYFT